MVVVPTPPFGLNTATIRRPRGSPMAVADTTGTRSRDRWKRSESASTRASSSAWSNGFVMTSSAPASRRPIRSSRSSACATARTGSWLVASSRRSSAITPATVYPAGTWSMMTRLWPLDGREQLDGVRDDGDPVARL